MAVDVEYIVLGLGGIGSAAAYWLSRRGGPGVLGLEQFELGHPRGASEDHSRIIRLSYHTPGYVRLAKEAYAAWEALEGDAGERVVFRTGGLDLWPAGAAITREGYVASLRAEGVPFEELDAAEAMRRWPLFRLPEDVRGLYQEDAGVVVATAANAAHRRMAVEHGATLKDRTAVVAAQDGGGEVEVQVASGDRYRCQRLIVAADAWTNDVLGWFGLRLPLTITQEQVTYFAPARPGDFASDRFPVWIWMDDPSFYFLPACGGPGPKIGQDVGGPVVTAQTRTFDPDLEARRRAEAFLERHLPAALGPVIETKTCLYTLTPDRDLVIDAVPGHPNVLVALGAAHGFKFASLIGKILAEMAVDGRTERDLSPFRLDRPLLTMEDPPTHFLT